MWNRRPASDQHQEDVSELNTEEDSHRCYRSFEIPSSEHTSVCDNSHVSYVLLCTEGISLTSASSDLFHLYHITLTAIYVNIPEQLIPKLRRDEMNNNSEMGEWQKQSKVHDGKPKLSWDGTAWMPRLHLINVFSIDWFCFFPPVGSSSHQWWGILSCDLLLPGSSWERPPSKMAGSLDCPTSVQWSTNLPPLPRPAGSGGMHCGILTGPKSTQVLFAGYLIIREGQEHFWGTWSVLTNLPT